MTSRVHGSRLLLALCAVAGLLLALPAAGQAAPRAAVGGLVSPAAGTLALSVWASDGDAGVASASALVDGAVVASATTGCAPGTACPELADLALAVDTTSLADGEHRLQVVVVDGAGGSATAVDQAIAVRNAPILTTSSVVVAVGSGADPGSGTTDVGGAGAGDGGGSTGAPVGGQSSTTAVACAAPKLSMMLAQKPLRLAHGRPVLKRNARYRFSGRLTCRRGTRRVSAPRGTKVELLNVIGKRVLGKSGTTVRGAGAITILLSYRSSRTIEFRYRSADGSASRVKIPVTVARR
ncbi:MAG TPA: hypothetical protein VFG42_08430 [Baekduia sp.]|uniref:hypothetical protein n=1 Tax=Baekduia sp. TaxID=2600305 RepID=UPI002D78D51D|nr:hypothetical protein [Baekduia sp.]HET6506802.1 hypothetical protein [Baekduia sp.]